LVFSESLKFFCSGLFFCDHPWLPAVPLVEGIAALSTGTYGHVRNVVPVDGEMSADQRPDFGVINPATVVAVQPWATENNLAARRALQAVTAACADLRPREARSESHRKKAAKLAAQ